MMGQETIAGVIRQHLRRLFLLVAAVVAIVGFSLYLFTSYVALVNDAGVVRGGSQRIVKQVLAGADASKTTAKIEGLLSGMSSRMHIGS
ncbi:MAG: methyl-accepting chemotaxis protein, partial [Selenomonas sp.]|nr:methyl-accepting chemotaxis protein [Selenomonas sp.]